MNNDVSKACWNAQSYFLPIVGTAILQLAAQSSCMGRPVMLTMEKLILWCTDLEGRGMAHLFLDESPVNAAIASGPAAIFSGHREHKLEAPGVSSCQSLQLFEEGCICFAAGRIQQHDLLALSEELQRHGPHGRDACARTVFS